MALPALFRSRPVTRWNDPFDSFERMMQRMLEQFPVEMAGDGYPVDISEEDDHVLVDAEMPGFKNEEIDVSISDDLLSIQAERTSEAPKGRPYLQERRFTRLQRTFRLPSAVDPNSVEAKLEGGVLHMEMKKSESAWPPPTARPPRPALGPSLSKRASLVPAPVRQPPYSPGRGSGRLCHQTAEPAS